jgi:predicted transcriptional regulator YheO
MKNNPIFKPYILMSKMIVETFGEDCEVVLHDLSDPEHSVVHVENSKITNRKVGQSFDHIVKQVIFSKNLKDDHVSNYYFKTANNKIIRSSTLLIRDIDNKLIGALCINIDTSKVVNEIEYLKTFLPNVDDNVLSFIDNDLFDYDLEINNDDLHVENMITSLIDNILLDCEPKNLSREEKIEKISFMDSKGIFLMKGSIEQVADKLGINKVTVYSYLDVVRGKR